MAALHDLTQRKTLQQCIGVKVADCKLLTVQKPHLLRSFADLMQEAPSPLNFEEVSFSKEIARRVGLHNPRQESRRLLSFSLRLIPTARPSLGRTRSHSVVGAGPPMQGEMVLGCCCGRGEEGRSVVRALISRHISPGRRSKSQHVISPFVPGRERERDPVCLGLVGLPPADRLPRASECVAAEPDSDGGGGNCLDGRGGGEGQQRPVWVGGREECMDRSVAGAISQVGCVSEWSRMG